MGGLKKSGFFFYVDRKRYPALVTAQINQIKNLNLKAIQKSSLKSSPKSSLEAFQNIKKTFLLIMQLKVS